VCLVVVASDERVPDTTPCIALLMGHVWREVAVTDVIVGVAASSEEDAEVDGDDDGGDDDSN